MSKSVRTLLAAGLLSLTACDKYVDFSPLPPLATQLPEEALAPTENSVTDTLQADAEKPDTVTSSEGVLLILPANCLEKCTDSSACVPCQGTVDVVMRVLFDKRDMLLFGKPTTSGSDLLETGGQVYLEITQNGVPLRFRPGSHYTLKIPVNRTRANRARMKYYADNTPGQLAAWWYQGGLAARDAEYYTIQSDKARTWLSPAYAYASGTPNTQISLRFTGEPTAPDSTQLFVVGKDVHAVVPTVRVADEFIPTCYLPPNQKITLVALSKQHSNWLLGMQEVTTEASIRSTMSFRTLTAAQAYELLEVLDQ